MIQKLILKALTPLLVLKFSTLIVFSDLDPNGKEQLLLALISGYFGSLMPNAESIFKSSEDEEDKMEIKRDRLM